MNYASSCVQTLDFLLRKHDKLLRDAAVCSPDSLRNFRQTDRKSAAKVTVEEHDRLFVEAWKSGVPIREIARRANRSHLIVWRIKTRKHPLYDAKRCEPLLHPPA